ncbi:6100_t:CDS:1, partial [Funneliformis geosporum]
KLDRINIFKNVSVVEIISKNERHSKNMKRKRINYCYSDTEECMTDSSDDYKKDHKIKSKNYESHHMKFDHIDPSPNHDVNGQEISFHQQLENVNVGIELKEIDPSFHHNERYNGEELRCAVSDFNKAIHINENQFVCNEPGCGKGFSFLSYLKQHQKLKHNMSQIEKVNKQQQDVKVIKCTLPGCNKIFKESKFLKKHLVLHKGEKPFICDEPGCGKRFALRDYVKTHQKRQHEMKRHENKHHQQSNKDNEEVKCPKPVKIHQKNHNNSSLCASDDCVGSGRLAKYPTEKNHIAEQRPIDDTRENEDFVLMTIRCPVPGCNRIFQKEKSLKKHLMIHNDERRFVCNAYGCGKKFVLLYYLRCHQKRHKESKTHA